VRRSAAPTSAARCANFSDIQNHECDVDVDYACAYFVKGYTLTFKQNKKHAG